MNQRQNPAGVATIRVFLVEDSVPVRELIVENCTAIAGVSWAGFSDSEIDALDQLESRSCDVLIVDIELRQGNGISLLRKLSHNGRHAGDLKIVFSNNICDAYRRVGAQYGVSHFLDKSFDLPNLCLLLQQHRLALQSDTDPAQAGPGGELDDDVNPPDADVHPPARVARASWEV